MRFRLLRCLARAIVKNGLKLACNVIPGMGAVYEVAADTWEEFNKDQRDEALRAEVQELAQAPPEQVRQDVQQAVEAEAAGQPAEVRQALTAYLTQVPAAIRRSLRRPSDPTGTTMSPALALKGPEDLMTMLPPRPPRFKPGDRPQGLGDWELEELLGMGGFGEVWRARHAHMRSKEPVALKFCLEPSAVAALRNEVGVLDRVMQHGRHAGIVPLLQTYLSANPPCLEYELVEGGDLAGLIQELHERKQMTVDLANRFFLSLVEIVAHAHRGGIVHGDLKPANVLVRRLADGKFMLRVTDFGIGGLTSALAFNEARQPTRSRLELVTEAVRGAYTPLYASPEQMTRRKGELADPRDDVHALGVIWYQLVTGDLGMMSMPTDWRDQIEERGLNTELIRLMGACMASRADKRPADAVVLGERLRGERLGNVLAGGELREWQPGDVMEVLLPGGVAMKFAWCPPGTFLMGSPANEADRGDDETQHRVTLTKGFWLGLTPVTQAQWQTVMGSNPSCFKGEDRPVEQVSWDDCQAFCSKLRKRSGKKLRLPTEAEWEYACRAGTTTPFSFGATITPDQVNIDGNNPYGEAPKGICRQQTTVVGGFPSNAWGLYDMHGNVWEWCADWYGPYTSEDQKDPKGGNRGGDRVLRGGSWYVSAHSCRSAFRNRGAPSYRSRNVGCRFVFCID